jgi:hypothetical protein
VLRHRIANRDAGGFRDYDVSLRINREVAADAASVDILIDTSAMTPKDVSDTLLHAIACSLDASKRDSSAARA